MTNYVHKADAHEPYHYLDSGLDNIWLTGGVERHETDYGPATSIKDIEDLHQAIAMDIIGGSTMTGEEFRFLRVELDLSQKVLAQLIKADEQQIHRWENNKNKIPGPAQVALGGYYIESINPDSRMKEHLDVLAQLDSKIEQLEERFFELTNHHWKATAA